MKYWFKRILIISFIATLLSGCGDNDVYKKMNKDSVVENTKELIEGFYLVIKQSDFKDQNEFSVANHWDLKVKDKKEYYDTKLGFLNKEIVNDNQIIYFTLDRQNNQKNTELSYLTCYSLLNHLSSMNVLYGFNVNNDNVIEREGDLAMEYWRDKLCKNYIYVDKFDKLTIAVKKDEFKQHIEENIKKQYSNIKEFNSTKNLNKGILNIIYSYQYPKQKEFLVNSYFVEYKNKEGNVRYKTKIGVLFSHKMLPNDKIQLQFGRPDAGVDHDSIEACQDFLVSANKIEALYGFNVDSNEVVKRNEDLNKPEIILRTCESYLNKSSIYSYLTVVLKVPEFVSYVKKTM